jgi:hypothetical protein
MMGEYFYLSYHPDYMLPKTSSVCRSIQQLSIEKETQLLSMQQVKQSNNHTKTKLICLKPTFAFCWFRISDRSVSSLDNRKRKEKKKKRTDETPREMVGSEKQGTTGVIISSFRPFLP